MHPLITALHSTDEATRVYAVQDIADMPELQPALRLTERLAVEDSRAVRDAIVFQLKQLNSTEVYALLFKLFTSVDAYLRNAAVDIFGAGGDEALGFLTAHLDHANREVRKLILDALFTIGSPAAVLAIRASLYDGAVNVRITAVEYLGRLEDRQSVPEMIALLNDDSDPMLTTAVLESLPYMASEADISRALTYLIPEADIQQANPLFVPEVLRLVARGADQQTLCQVIQGLTDLAVYADDFLHTISDAQNRYPDIICHDVITQKLVNILEDVSISENARHTACELLITGPRPPGTDLARLGMQLSDVPEMGHGAARLLAAAGTGPALARLQEIMATTGDQDLRRLCAELLEPEPHSGANKEGRSEE